MTRLYIAYRDIEDHQPRQSFEVIEIPAGGMIVKSQVLPGLYGHKPIHIKWHTCTVANQPVSLVTYTHQPITPVETVEINYKLEHYLVNNRLINPDDQEEPPHA